MNNSLFSFITVQSVGISWLMKVFEKRLFLKSLTGKSSVTIVMQIEFHPKGSASNQGQRNCWFTSLPHLVCYIFLMIDRWWALVTSLSQFTHLALIIPDILS